MYIVSSQEQEQIWKYESVRCRGLVICYHEKCIHDWLLACMWLFIRAICTYACVRVTFMYPHKKYSAT